MKSINVSAASTAELLAFYNANSGKDAVKRFSDRKTAERRVAALLSATPKASAHGTTYKQAYRNGTPVCPECDASSDITCGEVKMLHGEQHVVNEHIAQCHGCGHQWDTNTGKPRRRAADKAAASRSLAIAESWKDKKVAAARATRHHVVVTTPKGEKAEHRSVREAFMIFSLPLGRHIKFRSALKSAGKAEIDGYKFRLA